MKKTVKGKAEVVKTNLVKPKALNTWQVWCYSQENGWAWEDDCPTGPRAAALAGRFQCPTAIIHVTIPAIK